MDIRILGSRCAVSDDYADAVQRVADTLGLSVTIEKIYDEARMTPYDVSISCLYGYCPGCKNNHADSEQMHTPALVIDGRLYAHSVFLSDAQIADIFKSL